MPQLARVQRGRQVLPPRVLVYGTEGVGKSTFAAAAPKPIFLQTEDGLAGLDADRFPLATCYADVTAALDAVLAEPHDYETLVIDSLDWLERLIWDRVCQESGVSSIEKADGGYGKGYHHALSLWRDLLATFDRIRHQRGMVALLIAHSKTERFEDPERPCYDRYAPRLHKLAAGLVCEWCDAVLFASFKVRTQSEDAGFSRKRTIAHALGSDGGDRVVRCVGGPACVAKNRFSLPIELPLSWSAFLSALSASHMKGASNG